MSSPPVMATFNVPDHVCFGPDGRGGDFNYGQVRALTPQLQIEALRRRHAAWLVDQSKPLAASGASPFPLAVMACVGMEALGQIAYGAGPNVRDLSYPFVHVAREMDSLFSTTLTPAFSAAFTSRWSSTLDPKARTASVGDTASLLYMFFRNSMIHGYRGRAVFLTADETSSVKLDETEGTMALNPWWMWRRYEDVVKSSFDDIVNASRTPNPKRAHAVQRLALMLQ